jgi:hypothetical protein
MKNLNLKALVAGITAGGTGGPEQGSTTQPSILQNLSRDFILKEAKKTNRKGEGSRGNITR